MSGSGWNIAWKELLLGAMLSFAASVAFYHYTSETADLVFEVFPPARFTGNHAELGIYTVRLANIGSKEASDVRVHLEVPETTTIEEVKVEPNLAPIPYEIVQQKDQHFVQVQFPLLNAKESARFSLLVDKVGDVPIKVEVRGKGVVGRVQQNGESTSAGGTVSALNVLVLTLAGLVLLFAVATQFEQTQEQLRSYLSQQLRATRTQAQLSTPTAMNPHELNELLYGKTWRLYSVSARRAARFTDRVLRFGNDGRILEGSNQDEASWRLQSSELELLNASGRVHSRFYYSPTNQRFYNTNDPDTACTRIRGIKEQYLISEEPPHQSA